MSADSDKERDMIRAADISGYGDSGSYGALALVQCALGVSMSLFPQQAADFLFGPAGLPSSAIYVPLFRLLGVSLISSASKCRMLQV